MVVVVWEAYGGGGRGVGCVMSWWSCCGRYTVVVMAWEGGVQGYWSWWGRCTLVVVVVWEVFGPGVGDVGDDATHHGIVLINLLLNWDFVNVCISKL